jgi:hypothetical protein
MKMFEARNIGELFSVLNSIIGGDRPSEDAMNELAPKGPVMSIVEQLLHSAKGEKQFNEWSLAMETLPVTVQIVGLSWDKSLELRALGEQAIEDMSQSAFERFVDPFVDAEVVGRLGWWLDKYKFNEAICQEARDHNVIPHGVGLHGHHLDGGRMCFHPVQDNAVQARHCLVLNQRLANVLTLQSLIEAHKIVGADTSATERVLQLVRERDEAKVKRSTTADHSSFKH